MERSKLLLDTCKTKYKFPILITYIDFKIKITFVYNAKSGIANSNMNIGHKILSSSTYDCNLCNLTFGVLTENDKWNKFRKSSAYEMEFFNKDEFEKTFNIIKSYSTILQMDENRNMSKIVDSEILNEVESVEKLIQLLKSHIL